MFTKMRLQLCIILLAMMGKIAHAADSISIIKVIPMQSRIMTVDELGNVYVVRNDNSLIRFNEYGDSSAFYRSVQNGDIGAIDATNPMRILVYYPTYFRVVILDRQLSQKNDLDLRTLNVPPTSVVAASADGNLWIYDRFNARLKKIDEQLNEIVQSNDLRLEAQTVAVPAFMVERNWKVFLCDPRKGIFTFDRYGNYINTLEIYDVAYLQVYGSQLIYRHRDSLLSWDMNKAKASVMLIPSDNATIINAAVVRDRLYVLYNDRLVLYRVSERK